VVDPAQTKNRMQVQWKICGNETTWKI